MSKPKQNFHKARLIIKSVLGTLSDDEQHEFDKWLVEPDNTEFYSDILKSENISQKFQMFDSLDTNVAYSKLLKRTETNQPVEKRKSLFRLNHIYKYAAILLLMLTVGYSISYFSKTSIETHIATVEDLVPGYNKATLVLEDGSKINLEENSFSKKQTLTDIENDKSTLTYKSKNKQNIGALTQPIGINTLFVPTGGIYKLILPDGSKVWLNSSSSLKYPVSFASNQRIVELSGEAYFEVEKNSKDFVVKTKTRDVLVLGTAFNVSAYNDDAFFATTLTEGKIKLTHEKQKEVFLEAGQQAVVNLNALKIVEVEVVDPKVHSAWKDGTFFFENESLYKILHKVGRWYNFKTNFTDPELKNLTFTGLASKEFPAKRVLEMISKSTNVRYEMIQNTENEENLIRISRKE